MANGSITLSPKLIIESVQTVVPLKPTEHRSRLVTLDQNIGLGILRRWVHTVLYYKKVSQDDSGWSLAGWIKESLGSALLEQPFFAGRLRRRDGSSDQLFEIVSNDSGVRLYEAQMAVSMEEFLSSDNSEEGEAQLVHWEDIDALNPQFCPLFYVQVTNFKCGGYSIGFSYNILLADPFTMTGFIKQWANIHNNIVAEAKMPKLPLFYSPSVGKTGSIKNQNNGFVNGKNSGQTLIIKVTRDIGDHQAVAGLCMEEAGRHLRLGGVELLPAVFISLYVIKKPSEETKVEMLSKNEKVSSRPRTSISSGVMSCESWDDLGAHEIWVQEANRPPSRVSSWINSVADEGLVMVIPYSDEGEGLSGIRVAVTIPNDKPI